MTGWERWSTGNCATNGNLTIRTNGICKTQTLSWKIGFWDSDGSPNLDLTALTSDSQQRK